jgi:hypothetical protein
MLYFDHWTKVPANFWRWPNFSPEEIACRGTGKVGVDPDAMDKLQALRTRLGAPLMLNSAYRSPEHNRAVGGATGSQHLKARAFDVSMANHDPEAFEVAARAVGFTGFGFYRRNNFIHVDTGPDREWGARWRQAPTDPSPNRAASRFSPPPATRPETLAADTGAKSAAIGAGGAATVLTALGGVIGDLGPTAQIVAIVGALALIAGLGYIIRDKVREWL